LGVCSWDGLVRMLTRPWHRSLYDAPASARAVLRQKVIGVGAAWTGLGIVILSGP